MTAEAGCRAALYLRLSRDDTGRAGELGLQAPATTPS